MLKLLKLSQPPSWIWGKRKVKEKGRENEKGRRGREEGSVRGEG